MDFLSIFGSDLICHCHTPEDDEQPDELFHYTTLESAFFTLSPENDAAPKIRFTGVSRMNDNRETQIGKLLTYSHSLQSKSEDLEWLIDELQTFKIEPGVFCLTEKTNDIIQWQIYGDQGCGVQLGFSRKHLMRCRDMALIRVAYDQEHILRSFQHYSKLIEKCLEGKLIREPDDIVRATRYISPLWLSYKDSCWSHEKEWRLILHEPLSLPIMIRGVPTRCGYRTLVADSYEDWNNQAKILGVELDESEFDDSSLPLTSVCFGPNVDKHSRITFETILNQRGYSHIIPTCSELPLKPRY